MKRSGELRIGISGWRYPGWRGKFYPKGLAQRRELEYASSAFNSIGDQGLVLFAATTVKLSALVFRNTGRFYFRRQRRASYHPHEKAFVESKRDRTDRNRASVPCQEVLRK
jgi:hypothetical protein